MNFDLTHTKKSSYKYEIIISSADVDKRHFVYIGRYSYK